MLQNVCCRKADGLGEVWIYVVGLWRGVEIKVKSGIKEFGNFSSRLFIKNMALRFCSSGGRTCPVSNLNGCCE